MAVYKSRGIVLRSIRYGEADRILDLYTPERGVISAIAKGIRRTKSRFGARLEPLSCVEIMAYEGRTLDTITQAEVLRSFHKVRENLARLKAAGTMLGAVRSLAGGGEADRRVFNLLYRALDELEERTENFDAVEASFTLKLSALAGYALRLDVCPSCGEGVDGEGPAYFSPEVGGVLCAECRTIARDSFALAPGAAENLRELMGRPMREAAVEKRSSQSVRRVIESHLRTHAPGAIEPGGRRPA